MKKIILTVLILVSITLMSFGGFKIYEKYISNVENEEENELNRTVYYKEDYEVKYETYSDLIYPSDDFNLEVPNPTDEDIIKALKGAYVIDLNFLLNRFTDTKTNKAMNGARYGKIYERNYKKFVKYLNNFFTEEAIDEYFEDISYIVKNNVLYIQDTGIGHYSGLYNISDSIIERVDENTINIYPLGVNGMDIDGIYLVKYQLKYRDGKWRFDNIRGKEGESNIVDMPKDIEKKLYEELMKKANDKITRLKTNRYGEYEPENEINSFIYFGPYPNIPYLTNNSDMLYSIDGIINVMKYGIEVDKDISIIKNCLQEDGTEKEVEYFKSKNEILFSKYAEVLNKIFSKKYINNALYGVNPVIVEGDDGYCYSRLDYSETRPLYYLDERNIEEIVVNKDKTIMIIKKINDEDRQRILEGEYEKEYTLNTYGVSCNITREGDIFIFDEYAELYK